MERNNTDEIFQTRSPVDRRRVGGRRLFREQEYLDHNPERRVNMIEQRIYGDRRRLLPDILNTFGEDVL
jgi:hypothetical protein